VETSSSWALDLTFWGFGSSIEGNCGPSACVTDSGTAEGMEPEAAPTRARQATNETATQMISSITMGFQKQVLCRHQGQARTFHTSPGKMECRHWVPPKPCAHFLHIFGSRSQFLGVIKSGCRGF
jgi:hypothetical protein